MRWLCSCCWVWLWLASLAVASDIYVDNIAGDDRSDGGVSQGVIDARSPVRTIAKALRLARSGDHIVVANTGQVYRESLTLTGAKHSGSEVGPFVIQGNGATLEGASRIRADAWTYVAGDVFCFQPTRLGYQQLFLAGRPAVRRPAGASDVSLPALEPLEWCLWSGRIYFRVELGKLPADYELACCNLRTGITLYYVHDVLIQDLVVHGFQSDGIQVNDVAREIQLVGVTARWNGRSGIAVTGASRAELESCLLGDNGASQLLNEDFAQTRVYRSRLIADTGPAVISRGGRITFDEPITEAGEP